MKTTHPLYSTPLGLQQAFTCPECGQDGRTTLLHQMVYFGRDGMYITVENAFECGACRRRWWQTLKFQPGDVLENTIR